MYYHPKYYAALRAERRKLQASSAKPQASRPERPKEPSSKHQAASDGELRAKAYAKLASRIMGKP